MLKKTISKSKYTQGFFTPKNPEKYVGNIQKIRYMSSWELHLNQFFDNNPNVLRWSSENIAIPYIKPTDGKIHKYYPDYWVEYRTKDGKIIQEIMECKPLQQTKKPRSNHKHVLYESVMYAINQAKWAAAVQWCEARGIRFRIVTEKSAFR